MPLGVHCLFAQEADRVDDPGSGGEVEDVVAGGGGGGAGGLGVAEDGQCSFYHTGYHSEHVRHKPSTLGQGKDFFFFYVINRWRQ